ncbi:MAG: winged helix-turn-helix transcriptional regulator [Betaproteobacteria bacterium]|jgi:DNA-binding MarR family transcriptional regulator|nr:winged helix-turn-helix transcriptional regulator [Betaproteobacteria bacterium]
MNNITTPLALEVLQQFRVIYGTMRQYFRELEDICGLPGSQTWVLQEVEHTPEIGITDLAGRLGIHQSTCSILVEKLVAKGYLVKQKMTKDQRRIGLRLSASGKELITRLPGPAEGVLPEALSSIPLVSLKTLHINLDELIQHMPGKNETFAATPLAEMVRDQE